jgi:hypothetical protein
MRAALLSVLLFVATSAAAETLIYELYELSGPDGRKVLASGVRNYTVKDVVVQEFKAGDHRIWSKEIPVAKGFSAGISIFEESGDLTGFGLWLKDRESYWGQVAGGGFSWDWFDREAPGFYRKLQGGGTVRVTFVPTSKFLEIGSIEVLEDITLRVQVRPWFLSFFSHADTHHLLLRKGSVLRFAP